MFRMAWVSLIASVMLSPAWGTERIALETQRPKTLSELIGGVHPKDDRASPEEDRIEPDRPHYPEATSAVGRGRSILEAGYTFSKGGGSTTHAFPETLLRYGVLWDWFEVRLGQNAVVQRQMTNEGTARISGLQDLYLGFKVAVTEQQGMLPAIAVIPQMTVPTGHSMVTAGRTLPGVNVDLSWEIVKNFFAVEVLIANNSVRDDLQKARHELGTGITGAFHVTKDLEAFVEWNAFYPGNGYSPAPPRHYIVGGLVYFLSSDLAVDVRVGVGLNKQSDDLITGVGFAKRF